MLRIIAEFFGNFFNQNHQNHLFAFSKGLKQAYIMLVLVLILLPTSVKCQSLIKIDQLNYLWNEDLFDELILKARKKGDSSAIIILKNLQASELLNQRKYPEAESLLLNNLSDLKKISIKAQQRVRGDFSPIDVHDILGRLYTETANYRKAENFLSTSASKKAEIFKPSSGILIKQQMVMAKLQLNQEQWNDAEQTLLKLAKGLKRTPLKSQLMTEAYQIYLRGMAVVCLRLNRVDEAGIFIKKAFSSHAPLTEYLFYRIPESKADQQLINLKGEYLLRTGQTTAGLKLLSDSNDSEAIRVLVLYYLERADFAKALDLSKKLLSKDLNEITERYPVLTQEEQEALGRKTDQDFNLALTLAYLLEETGKPADIDFILNFRLSYKGFRLNQSIKVLKFLQNTADKQVVNYYNKFGRLKNELSTLAVQKPLFGKEKVDQRLEILRDSIELLERRIQLAFVSQSTQPKVMADSKKILEHIKTNGGDAAVEIIRFEEIKGFKKENVLQVHYLVLVLAGGKIRHTWLENGAELESRYLTLYQKSMINRVNTQLTYEHFLKPIIDLTEGSEKIFLSVDGLYHLINPETLFDGNGYVLGNKSFFTLSNLSELLTNQTSNFSDSGIVTFIARPAFDLEKSDQQVNPESLSRAFYLEDLKNAQFSDLPGTEKEAKLSSQELKNHGYSTITLSGKVATEDEIKKIKSSDIIHFATHGFFLEKSSSVNPMFESGLILAGINNSHENKQEDGILTAYEAAQLSIPETKLVVLSACETGLGQVSGSEGVYGLPRAFQLAGAEQVIMSLWKVDDTGTQKLMTLFYRNLVKTKNVHTAFRSAQLELIKEYPDPYFWGAFKIIGK